MKLRILWIGGWWIGGWAIFALTAVCTAQQTDDPPARVARLSYLDGWVSFRPGNLTDWASASLNFPLTTGSRLWTDREAHAELHIGATAVHLAPWTALNVMRLDDLVTQLSVAEGTLYLRVPRMDEGETVEIDTPNGALTVLQPGAYRIDADPGNDATSFTVRSGEAEVSGNGRVTPVHVGQMLQLVANADVASIQDALPPDPWEEWCAGRDGFFERGLEVSADYVTPEMDGAEDLGSYGDWSTDGSYGTVWRPRNLPAGWAPYRFGHWAYISPWGWTWIDNAPWGFAPFHYGRWVHLDSGWMWVPGNRVTHPVYSPAMVAFVGSSASRNGRITAWIPLAPGEWFRPGYRASESYVRRINLPQGRDRADGAAAAVYRNREFGVAVGQDAFTGARSVAASAVAFPENARLARVDIAPSRESYVGRRTPVQERAASPPDRVSERAVIVRHELPADVSPASPIRGAVRPPEASPDSPPAERAARRSDDPQPDTAAPIYLSLPSARAPRREEVRSESSAAPPAPEASRRNESRREEPRREEPRREEPRREASAPPQHHEETRREVSAPAPQRHEETRHETAAPPPQHHEETRHETPAPAPQRHEEPRSSPAQDRGQDRKDDGGSRKK